MKRIIHTFVIAFQFIILSAVLTACKEDDGNISSPQEVTPSFFWKGVHFSWKRTTVGVLPALPTASPLAISIKNANTISHGTAVREQEKDKRHFKDSRSRKETANHPSRRIAHRRHQWNVLQHPFPKRRSNGYIAILQITMQEQTECHKTTIIKLVIYRLCSFDKLKETPRIAS